MWCHYSCGPKQIIPFFDSQKQPARDELGDMRTPGALTYNQTQQPECPDSDSTTANSRCDSLLSKKHKTALYRKINHYGDGRPGPLSLPADLGKGGATFKSLIVLSRPCLDSASLNHRHTYLVDADQCFVGLQKV